MNFFFTLAFYNFRTTATFVNTYYFECPLCLRFEVFNQNRTLINELVVPESRVL